MTGRPARVRPVHAAVRTGGWVTWPATGYRQVSAEIYLRCTCGGVVCRQVGHQAGWPTRRTFVPGPKPDAGRPKTGIHLGRGVLNPC
jgi:hypothetical protein